MKQNKLPEMTQARLMMWWFPLGVGILVVAGFFLILIPKTTQIIENRSSLKAKQENVKKLQDKATALTTLDVVKTDRLYELVNVGLPSTKPLFEMMAQLQAVAGTAEVALNDFDLNPGSVATEEAKANSREKVAIRTSLTVQGTYENITKFLDVIQETLPLFTVTGVSFSTQEENVTRATMDIEVYYQPAAKLAQNAEQRPLPKLDKASEEALNTISAYLSPAATAETVPMVDSSREDIFNF